MKIIETIAPIPIEKLKIYFEEKDVQYSITYKDSILKGSKLLIYLSNLDIPCDIDLDYDDDEFFPLLTDYLNSPFLIDGNLKLLHNEIISILCYKKKIFNLDSPIIEYENFIENNKEILDKWEKVLDSCMLYNFYIVKVPEFQEYVKSFPKASAEDEDLRGINFVNLFKYEYFYTYYLVLDKTNFRYYEKYFNEYFFKGKNLFNYWATKENPYFLMNLAITDKNMNAEDYIEAKNKTIEELSKQLNLNLPV